MNFYEWRIFHFAKDITNEQRHSNTAQREMQTEREDSQAHVWIRERMKTLVPSRAVSFGFPVVLEL